MMNALEKYLFGEEQWKERFIDLAQNDWGVLCGHIYRYVAYLSGQVSRKSGLVFREYLVIDLDNEIKRVIVSKPYGEEHTFEKDGKIVDIRGVKRHNLRSIYGFFYTLNQIIENEGKSNG